MGKRLIKNLLRHLGYECRRYNVGSSENACLIRMLDIHGISVVIDVGANCGQYALQLRDSGYRGYIISFEPLSEAYLKLVDVAKNDPLWTIYPRTAVGDCNGNVTINVAANSQSSSILNILEAHVSAAPSSRYVSSEIVPIIRLDRVEHELIGFERGGAFLKIDVQGFEKNVLVGAESVLRHIRGVRLELSLVQLYEGQELLFSMVEYLENLGFELWSLLPGFVDKRTGRELQADGIFFKKELLGC